jgi:ribosome-associated translation inhibitor RaiA
MQTAAWWEAEAEPMRLEIRRRNVPATAALREHIERRILFALARFSNRVARVTVRVSDVNGPHGGLDKLCRIMVVLRGARNVQVEDLDAGLYAVIDRAADRAGRSVGRELARDRGGPSLPATGE